MKTIIKLLFEFQTITKFLKKIKFYYRFKNIATKNVSISEFKMTHGGEDCVASLDVVEMKIGDGGGGGGGRQCENMSK